MKSITLLGLLLMISIFGFMLNKKADNKYSVTRGEVVYELLDKINKVIKNKYNLAPLGTTVGMPEGNVKVLGSDFRIYQYMTQKEARRLLIDCAESFIPLINADKRVSSYLADPPFNIKNLNISIFIADAAGNAARYPNLTVIGIQQGILSYEVWEGSSPEPIITKSRVTETYEEAKAILNQESSS